MIYFMKHPCKALTLIFKGAGAGLAEKETVTVVSSREWDSGKLSGMLCKKKKRSLHKHQHVKPLLPIAEHPLKSQMAWKSHKQLLLLSQEKSWVCCYLLAHRQTQGHKPKFTQVIRADPAVLPTWMYIPAASQIYKGICGAHTWQLSSPSLTKKKKVLTACSSTQKGALSLLSLWDTRGNTTLIPSFITAPRKNTYNAY